MWTAYKGSSLPAETIQAYDDYINSTSRSFAAEIHYYDFNDEEEKILSDEVVSVEFSGGCSGGNYFSWGNLAYQTVSITIRFGDNTETVPTMFKRGQVMYIRVITRRYNDETQELEEFPIKTPMGYFIVDKISFADIYAKQVDIIAYDLLYYTGTYKDMLQFDKSAYESALYHEMNAKKVLDAIHFNQDAKPLVPFLAQDTIASAYLARLKTKAVTYPSWIGTTSQKVLIDGFFGDDLLDRKFDVDTLKREDTAGDWCLATQLMSWVAQLITDGGFVRVNRDGLFEVCGFIKKSYLINPLQVTDMSISDFYDGPALVRYAYWAIDKSPYYKYSGSEQQILSGSRNITVIYKNLIPLHDYETISSGGNISYEITSDCTSEMYPYVVGSVTFLGNPNLDPYDDVDISGVEGSPLITLMGDVTGMHQTRVRHVLDGGFTTYVESSEIDETEGVVSRLTSVRSETYSGYNDLKSSIVYASGDTYTAGSPYLPINGVHIGNNLYMLLPLPKSIGSTTPSVTAFTGIPRGVNGQLDSGTINFKTGNYSTSIASIDGKNMLLTIAKNAAWTNGKANSPVNIMVTGITISFT